MAKAKAKEKPEDKIKDLVESSPASEELLSELSKPEDKQHESHPKFAKFKRGDS